MSAAAGGTIARPGAELAWEARGAGPLLVCSHAWGGEHSHWAWHVPVFAQRFRVVTWDLRGHGASTTDDAPFDFAALVEDLAAVIDAAGGGPAALVGASMGAEITLGFAATYPARVRGLAVAGVVGGAWPAERRARYQTLVRRALVEGPAALAGELAAVLFPEGFLQDRPAERRRFEQRLAVGQAGPLAQLARAALEAPSVLPRLAAVTAPALVLVGANDPVTPPPLAAAVAAALPAGRLEVLPGRGHLCLIEDPTGTAARIVAFLTSGV